jgi:PleD family two-component response regulator
MTAPPTGGEPIFGAAPGTSDAAAPGWSGFAVSQHATIMMVDDDEVIVAAVQAFLESVGYSQFASTTHPAEAPAMVERVRPDLLLI